MFQETTSSDQESRRLAAKRRRGRLDTPPDEAFDRFTRRAVALFDAPVAVIGSVDHDRICFESRHGLDVTHLAREPGLCASVIARDGATVLGEARLDPSAGGGVVIRFPGTGEGVSA